MECTGKSDPQKAHPATHSTQKINCQCPGARAHHEISGSHAPRDQSCPGSTKGSCTILILMFCVVILWLFGVCVYYKMPVLSSIKSFFFSYILHLPALNTFATIFHLVFSKNTFKLSIKKQMETPLLTKQ